MTVITTGITESPISVTDLEPEVVTAECGAAVTFSGIIRDHDSGRGVTRLVYESHPLAPAQVAPAQLNDLTQSLFALVVIGILLSVFVADGICVRAGLQHGFVIVPLPLVVFNPPLANWLSLAGFSAAAAVFASFLFAPRGLSREFILRTPALNIGNKIGGLAQLAFVAHQVFACAAFVTASSCRFHRQGRETHLVG